jgi:PPM family protein phosphatase
MEGNNFQVQLQNRISMWLESGSKSGLTELEYEKIVLCSVLGKRSENQDRAVFLRVKFDERSKPSIAALILCDGMGGMVSGGDCANLAISSFSAALVNSNARTLIDKLKDAVSLANKSVYKEFQGRGGSTLSAALLNDLGEWAMINVGDSRIYHILSNGVIEQLTIDDTLEKQLAHLNLPSPPKEFRQLLQYIGMGVGIEPRAVEFKLSSESKYLLITSDGAHGISENVFQSLVNCSDTSKEVVSRLTKISEWLGGNDNSTAVILPLGKNIFLRNKDSDSSSLEIWSITGKVEFLSVKNSQNTISLNNTDEAKNEKKSNFQKIPYGEGISPPEKKGRKKDKNTNQYLILDDKNSDIVDVGKFEKPIPNLIVEFVEEN